MNKKGQIATLLTVGGGAFILSLLFGAGVLYVILQNSTLIAVVIGILIFTMLLKLVR